jgi:predicted nuclease of predicted toxin-antitoxin system
MVTLSIKVDEDLPHAAADCLRQAGYRDVLSVLDQGMGGWSDEDLWREILREGRFLVTADKGFANSLLRPPGSHQGILLLRPDADGIGPIVELLELVVSRTRLESLVGTITVASPQGLRTRR